MVKSTNPHSWKTLIISLMLIYGIALIGAIAVQGEPQGDWYASIRPEITPPNWLFPIVWNILYFLIALSLWLSWSGASKNERKHIAAWYGVNLVANALWSILFFGLHNPTLAFVDIVLIAATIIGMMITSWKISRTASLLLAPYAAWVLFATLLNYIAIP